MRVLTTRSELALSGQTLDAQMLGALLAADLMNGMVTAAMWIFNDDTLISRVASLCTNPEALAYTWIALAVVVVPYFCMQTFGVLPRWRRSITRWACRAILASGVIWAYLAYLSKNIDSTNVTWVFVLHSFICVAMSAILAISINATQGREQQLKESS